MNKLTPEQALADVKAVRRDRGDSYWLDCACVLADWNEWFKGIHAGVLDLANELRTENAKLRAELDALNAAPAATETPALARFLPRRPADVPAPPEGWVYVGMGFEQPYGTKESKDIAALLEWCAEWNVGQAGRDPCKHYTIRWTAEPDIWHRFGLLAPSEGGGWIPHCPGDAMPCEGRCEVLLKGEMDDAQFRLKPGEVRYGTAWCWDADHADNNIIGWRPAVEVAT